MNSQHRKPLPGTRLDSFDARAAMEALIALIENGFGEED